MVLHDSRRLALLQRYEPVIRYNQGELFYPTRVDEYVASSALFAKRGKNLVEVAPAGTLSLERLDQVGRESTGRSLSLQRVAEPLNRAAFKAWRNDPARSRFKPSSRFAAVGLLSRLIDAVMRLTLLLRGRVPGGYAAASQLAYVADSVQDSCTYYGHVTADGGYIVLQYWYFYSMNDWRSTFGGVNDHEADWEQVTIFVTDTEEPVPVWVAFSSHDEVGDDLRRRWDDPDIELVDGTHPVVYAGAGSHSGAYLRGEYLVTAPIPLPRWIDSVRRGLHRMVPWRDDDDPGSIGIPYIDYRRGDGLAVGPGGDRSWDACLITDETPWVRDYRGLWGLDTKDPLGGERAPAGPRYNRNETVRQSWAQPVAWAGLDKEEPTDEAALERLVWARSLVGKELEEANAELEVTRNGLRAARAADRAVGLAPTKRGAQQAELAAAVEQLRDRQSRLRRQLEGIDRGMSRDLPVDPVHAHLQHRAQPLTSEDTARGRLLRFWSAASVSILLAALGVVLLVQGTAVLPYVLAIAAVMMVIEAILRGVLLKLVVGVVVLAFLVVGILAIAQIVVGNLRLGFGIALLLAACYMAVQTAREGLATR